MAKILISSLGLGLGALDKKDPAHRTYRKATYQIDGKSYPRSFIASVLYEHLKLDGIIFIGTVKSMWEEVYRFFCEEKNQDLDVEYWIKLAEETTNPALGYKSSLDSLNLSPINKVLGKRSQCILIQYGLNEEELWVNFDKIIQVIKCLQKGDELYIDITHSFRSLSLFLFVVLVFIKDLYSEKEIKISGVYYGMLDVSSELGYTPVVDLQSLFHLTDWIKGTYSLKYYGDGSLIADLLAKQGDSTLAKELQSFSEAVNLNYLTAIQQRGISLRQRLKSNIPQAPFKYLKKFLEDFLQRFEQKHESDFQLELAGWYFKNKRYATGYITLQEAILTYLCEISQKDPNIREDRDKMKSLIHQRNYKHHRLSQLYFDINDIRKNVAHALDGREDNCSEDIKKASKYQNDLKSIFKSGTWGEDLFRSRGR